MQSKRVLMAHRRKEERKGEDDGRLSRRRAVAHDVRVGAPRRIQMLSSDRATRGSQRGVKWHHKAWQNSPRGSEREAAESHYQAGEGGDAPLYIERCGQDGVGQGQPSSEEETELERKTMR